MASDDEEDASRAIISAQNGEPPPAISLVDHTRPQAINERTSESDFSRVPSSLGGLSRNLTHGSIRQTIARRKYQRSKWQQDSKGSISFPTVSQPGLEDVAESSAKGGAVNHVEGGKDTPTASAPATETQEPEDLDWGKSSVRKRGRKVKDRVWGTSAAPKVHTKDPDAHVDVLYENQRGFFFFGIPRFSSNSLLQIDPGAWLDQRLRPSAVNITNAQVPDPSWEWAWRTWYVDMSGDVDEEGWEYSFAFAHGCAWHGTHPWFHSFVRRRRWLRKRSKRKGFKAKDEAHALTADYFTIHAKAQKLVADDASMIGTTDGTQRDRSATVSSAGWGAKSWEDQWENMEVSNIPDLMKGLRRAAVDREKIVLVRRFLNQAGDELHYLAENMEPIMKLLVFQNSRRQLLALLMHEFEAADQHRDEHEERGEAEDEIEKRHLDNLLKAVESADDLCKQLEYWSDIKGMAREGEIMKAADHSHGWDHTWQGVDQSGPEIAGGSPTDTLSEGEEADTPSPKQDKGKGKERVGTQDSLRPPTQDSAEGQPRRSTDTTRTSNDMFYSPLVEKSQAQAMAPSNATASAGDIPEPPEMPERKPSQASEISVDSFESAQSEPDPGGDYEEEDDDQATERAPSEDERDDGEDTEAEKTEKVSPPAGVTPIEALLPNPLDKEGEDKGKGVKTDSPLQEAKS